MSSAAEGAETVRSAKGRNIANRNAAGAARGSTLSSVSEIGEGLP